MADMSKTNALFGEPQAGQPANASAGEPVQQAAQQPDLSTLINKAIAENVPQVVNQALEAFSRKQQSQRDQQEARIAKKFQETLENIRASGIEPTQDQANAIRQKVANAETNQEQAQPSQPTAGQPQDSGAAPDMGALYAVRDAIYELVGVKLDASDPEAQAFQDTTDPTEFRKRMIAATQAKKQRLEGGAMGRLGVLPTSGPASRFNEIANITDPAELIRMGLTK
jgi:hypothetical protein